MAHNTEPTKFTTAWGGQADVNVIPDTAEDITGAASVSKLFPIITQLPLPQGGVAPSRVDMNGLLKVLGENIQFKQKGGVYTYDSSITYDKGNIVLYANELYLSTADDNTASPTDTSAWSKLIVKTDTATTSNAGAVTLATSSEATAGTNTTKAVTPAALKASMESKLEGYVYTAKGVQDIGFGKRFSNQIGIFNDGIDVTATRTSADYDHLTFFDKNRVETAAVEVAHKTDSREAYLRVDNAASGSSKSAFLSVKIDNSGNAYAYCTATPSITSNDSEIVTTQWARKYLVPQQNTDQIIASHNSLFRGDNLLSGHFSSISDVCSAVSSGNFSDIYVGDYIPAAITYSGTTTTHYFRVAGINSFMQYGDTALVKNHLVIVPDTPLTTSYMNSTSTTEGGYVGSYMYTTVLPALLTSLSGSSSTPFYGHIISSRQYLTNKINTSYNPPMIPWHKGVVDGAGWYDNSLMLMRGQEIYGADHEASSARDTEACAISLPLFRIDPWFILGGYNSSGAFVRQWYWLCTIASSTAFCGASDNGNAGYYGAAGVVGVRPRFLIG